LISDIHKKLIPSMKKNILVTGAAGNLGKAVVDTLKGVGYTVLALVSPGKSSTISDPQVNVYEADLTQERDVADQMTKIIQKHQTIDACVLLAGGYAHGGFQDADGSAVKKMISINFETAYHIARLSFQQMMKQSHGRIILVGARPALDAKAGKQSVAYALSKSLIFTLAQLLNADGAEKNVVTSVIVPSIIDTPVNRNAMPKADFSSWVSPEAIAEHIAFLLSDRSDALREPVVKLYGRA
jgi:NAD(P)-dependent dehydrogenase (short-subunit alcohol dehydrogenase family)